MAPIRIECELVSPLCGDPPHLDALLEGLAANRFGLPALCRSLPCPAPLSVPIPIEAASAPGGPVYRTSSPIFAATAEGVRRLARQFPADRPESLHPKHRGNIILVNGPHKSWYLPLRERLVPRVVWFAVGDQEYVTDLLRGCFAIGKVRGKGSGAVARWRVEPVTEDWSWFAASPAGLVLMRPLPAGEWLPTGLTGWKADFGACRPPYWHHDRYGELVSPC